jgi:hypothetical protein
VYVLRANFNDLAVLDLVSNTRFLKSKVQLTNPKDSFALEVAGEILASPASR